jgi:hypothetical protein
MVAEPARVAEKINPFYARVSRNIRVSRPGGRRKAGIAAGAIY